MEEIIEIGKIVLSIYLWGAMITGVLLFLSRDEFVNVDEKKMAILNVKATLIWFITVPLMIYWFFVELRKELKK